jgi:hypothetical protein
MYVLQFMSANLFCFIYLISVFHNNYYAVTMSKEEALYSLQLSLYLLFIIKCRKKRPVSPKDD